MTTNNAINVTSANSASLVSNSSGVLAMTASMTNGQVVIGSTGATPTPATLTAGSGIAISNGAGSITVATTALATNVNPNILIGGNMDTNPWQRGVTFAAAATGYTADRWRWSFNGTAVVTISKAALAPTVNQAGFAVTNSLQTNVTTAQASIGAANVYRQTYFVEGLDWAQVTGSTCTLSFWVYATVTGVYCVSALNAANTRCFIAEYTVSVSNTWQYVTINITDSSGTGSWNYGEGQIGLQLNFVLACGSNFQGSTGWQTTAGAVYATSNQVNAVATNGNKFNLTLVKLEAGSNATAYPVELEKDVLSRAERYFETSASYENGFYFPNVDQTGAINVQMPTSGTDGVNWYVPFRSRKAVTPTMTVCDNNATTGAVYKGVAGATANIVSIGNNGFNGGTANATNSNALYFHYTANAELL